MKIHEYQAKSLFKDVGIPVSSGVMIEDPAQAESAVADLPGKQWVVKAQVHAGGRGKAGGIKLVDDKAACAQAVKDMIGLKIVNKQTGEAGKIVNKVLVQEAVDIAEEFYAAVTLDRSQGKGVVIASSAGGVDIEEVAQSNPDAILKSHFDIVQGLAPFQARDLAFALTDKSECRKAFASILMKLAELFVRFDATLVEINPLAILEDGSVSAVDAKIDFDDNGLYRHPAIAEMRDPTEEDEREVEARKYGLSYVGLDGNVGCMVNGAGLAMGTMDAIQIAGGMPANFLDVGGGAKVEQVKAAFEIILRDKNVKAILVNIFGGIMKCDVIAEGVIQAAKEINISLPLVVRLEGTNVEKGKQLLAQSGIKLVAADGLYDAAKQVVELAGK